MAKLIAFKKGDRVEWTAGGPGGTHVLSGAVVGVVPPGDIPEKYVPKGKTLNRDGLVRPHKSYVILGDEGRIYWPRVSALKAGV